MVDQDSNGTVQSAEALVKQGNQPPVFIGSTAMAGGSITLVSATFDGSLVNGEITAPTISDDGTKVAFVSNASNLVTGDTNGTFDVFVTDLKTGLLSRVSTLSNGSQINGASQAGAIAPDGTKVVFQTYTANPSGGNTLGTYATFIKSLDTGLVTRLAVNNAIETPVFSKDGTKLAFRSNAPSFTTSSIMVADLTTGAITPVSTAADGTLGNSYSVQPSFSADGTKVAFASLATNLVPGDTNGAPSPSNSTIGEDVFVKDLVTGAITRVSMGADGAQGNGPSDRPSLSADGSKVAFESDSSNLVTDDVNDASDVFVKDLMTGAIAIGSARADGTQGAGSFYPALSPDGTRLAFSVNGDSSVSYGNIIVKDLATGATSVASSNQDGIPGDDVSGDGGRSPMFSADGTKLVFQSMSDNLVPGQRGGIFVKDLATSLAASPSGAVTDDAAKTSVSTTGRLLFTDPESTDSHTVSVTAAGGDLGTLAATVSTDSTGATTGIVGWTYQVTHDAASVLAKGKTKIDTFTVAVDDGHGGTADQTVAVTVTGTDHSNQPPLLGVGVQSTPLVESGVGTAGVAGATIALTASDPDAGDRFTFDPAGWTNVDATHLLKSGTHGTVVLDTGTGVLAYTLDNTKPATNALAAGAAASDAFSITLEDTSGAKVTKTATFAITGTNDAPAFVATAVGTTGGAITRVSDLSSNVDFGLSADGTKIALASSAANGSPVVVIEDIRTGVVTSVPTLAGDAQGSGASFGFSFSSDLTKMAFTSNASDFGAGDTNGALDVFVEDLVTGAITRVSTAADGAQANGESKASVISADGTKVAFDSFASNLVPGVADLENVYVKDLTTGAVSLASSSADGTLHGGGLFSPFGTPALSEDGTTAAFVGPAGQLLGTNRGYSLLVKDLTTGLLTDVATPSIGLSDVSDLTLSADGTKLAFTGNNQIYVIDLTTGTSTVASSTADGTLADNTCLNAVISADGTKVAFESVASNLAAGATFGRADIFVKNLVTGALTLASAAADGTRGNDSSMSTETVFSANGTKVAFQSGATNLVPGDATGGIFVKDLATSLAASPSGAVTDDAAKTSVSTTGRLLFTDPESTDSHTVSVTAAGGDLGTLAATVSTDSTGATTGIVGWTYQVTHDAASVLAKGKTKIDTFTVAVDDGHGGTADQTVAVTVTGTGARSTVTKILNDGSTAAYIFNDGVLAEVVNTGLKNAGWDGTDTLYRPDGKKSSESFERGGVVYQTEGFNTDGSRHDIAYQHITGHSYTSFDVLYDAGRKQVSATYSDGMTATWEYDPDGSLRDIAYDHAVEQSVSSYKLVYDAKGRIASTIYPSGMKTEATYNADNSLHDVLYTNVPAQAYRAYDVVYDGGKVAQYIFDNKDGSHRILGAQDGQTFTSLHNDTFTTDKASETFVFKSGFGHDTIVGLAPHLAGLGHDTISLPASAFTDFAALIANTHAAGGDAVISAPNGDTLTLAHVTVAAVAANPGSFVFHA